jgi:predicted ribosome-associated RNA-binding protein Tma20
MHHLHFITDCMETPCSCVPHGRHFVSKKERKEMLEKYKEQLEKELTGVSEKIEELSKKDS